MAKKTTFWQGWLMDNPLTEDPNDFTLKVKAGNMVTTEDIAKALQAEGSEFQLETLIDILNRGDRIIRNKLLAGYSVGTGVFYAYPSVSGVWRDKNETFDEKRHKVGVNFQLSATMREGVKQIGVEVLGVSSAGPEISSVTDTWTGELNALLTPDEVASVKGRNIQLAGEQANESGLQRRGGGHAPFDGEQPFGTVVPHTETLAGRLLAGADHALQQGSLDQGTPHNAF